MGEMGFNKSICPAFYSCVNMEHLQCSINSCGEGIKGQGEGLLCGMYLAINKM